jgi:hypothetical protein
MFVYVPEHPKVLPDLRHQQPRHQQHGHRRGLAAHGERVHNVPWSARPACVPIARRDRAGTRVPCARLGIPSATFRPGSSQIHHWPPEETPPTAPSESRHADDVTGAGSVRFSMRRATARPEEPPTPGPGQLAAPIRYRSGTSVAYPPRSAGIGRWVNAWARALCPAAWSASLWQPGRVLPVLIRAPQPRAAFSTAKTPCRLR